MVYICKRCIQKLDAVTPTQGTYSATGTVLTVTLSGGHNLEIGQKVFLDFLTYNTEVVPTDDTFEVGYIKFYVYILLM